MQQQPSAGDDSSLRSFLRALPKAEMHIHLEGSLRWSRLSPTDGPAVAPWLADGPPDFTDFSQFRSIFGTHVTPALGTPARTRQAAADLLADLIEDGVVAAQINVAPQMHESAEQPMHVVCEALADAASEVAKLIAVRWIIGLRRADPPEKVLADWTRWEAESPDGFWHGIDLQSDERLGEAHAFMAVYDAARDRGRTLRAHAGEIAGPASVRQAIDSLRVPHLSHGTRAIEDPALVAELADRGIYLHLCPTSNLCLRVVPTMAAMPVRSLLDAGCRVTLNSDDSLLFGATILDEYETAGTTLGLSRRELCGIARTSLESFGEPAATGWIPTIDRIQARLP